MTKPSFSENYQLLNDIAQKLRTQEKPDIDALLPMVENATQAYKLCKQRIEEVKKALDAHFADNKDLKS